MAVRCRKERCEKNQTYYTTNQKIFKRNGERNMRKNVLKKMGATLLALSLVVVSCTSVSFAKTGTYNGKTVTYTYEMGTVPYGPTNYLEVCTAKLSYPSSVSMKINGTITAKKNNSRYTMTGNKSGTGTSLKKEFAFDTPGYDIIHFNGVYTVGSKKFNIDTDI